jgi:hypothetical protein
MERSLEIKPDRGGVCVRPQADLEVSVHSAALLKRLVWPRFVVVIGTQMRAALCALRLRGAAGPGLHILPPPRGREEGELFWIIFFFFLISCAGSKGSKEEGSRTVAGRRGGRLEREGGPSKVFLGARDQSHSSEDPEDPKGINKFCPAMRQ